MKDRPSNDKFKLLCLLIPVEFHVLTAESISKCYCPLDPGVTSIFRTSLGPFNKNSNLSVWLYTSNF